METKIVILGAGYAGVRAALGLEKRFSKIPGVAITVIDRHDYHLFNPNLYEVAAADEDFADLVKLKKSVSLPLREIFQGKNLKFFQGEVKEIDESAKTVTMVSRKIHYDYLVVALGAKTDFMNVQGADEYGLPLKSLAGALRIRNQIEFAMQARRMSGHKDAVRVVVAGGGFTGVEFVAELAGEIKYLSWKNEYPKEKIEILLVQAGGSLIAGKYKKMGEDAQKRLVKLGVKVILGAKISEVRRNYVKLLGGQDIYYDVLVWAAGVRANDVPFIGEVLKDGKGRIVVNEFLQSKSNGKIFALGDCSAIFNKNQKFAADTAEDALWHGDYLSYALPLVMQNNRPKPYEGREYGGIAQVGGKYAIVDYGYFYFKGFLGYVLRQAANWNYLKRLLGFKKATKYLFFQMKIYSRND